MPSYWHAGSYVHLYTEWLFVRDQMHTSTGYSSGTALNLPRQGTSEARIVLGRFASLTDERSEDRLRVRVGLDTSFMAIYMNITVYTSEDHRNNPLPTIGGHMYTF